MRRSKLLEIYKRLDDTNIQVVGDGTLLMSGIIQYSDCIYLYINNANKAESVNRELRLISSLYDEITIINGEKDIFKTLELDNQTDSYLTEAVREEIMSIDNVRLGSNELNALLHLHANMKSDHFINKGYAIEYYCSNVLDRLNYKLNNENLGLSVVKTLEDKIYFFEKCLEDNRDEDSRILNNLTISKEIINPPFSELAVAIIKELDGTDEFTDLDGDAHISVRLEYLIEEINNGNIKDTFNSAGSAIDEYSDFVKKVNLINQRHPDTESLTFIMH